MSNFVKCSCNQHLNTIIDTKLIATGSLSISRFKAQFSKFSGIISKPYSKTTKRFFTEMLYGIQAGKDIKLSNIGRRLQEDIELIKPKTG